MSRIEVIPEKGRYCTKSLRYLLGMDWVDTVSRMDDAINNGGSDYYTPGLSEKIESDRARFDEMRFDGYDDEIIIRGEENPLKARYEDGVDAIYVGEDLVVETALEEGWNTEIPENWSGIPSTADSLLSAYGFDREERLGPDISWSPMEYGTISRAPETVLVPEEWRNLGGLVARDRFGGDIEIRTIPEGEDEETRIAESGATGVYMYESGGTAESAGLDYVEPVPERWRSRLGVFEAEDSDQVFWPRRYDGFR
ncbi:MAG: hypothetical protein ABEJ62_00890 [Candidatus Nanohaloarchaea archaeon]